MTLFTRELFVTVLQVEIAGNLLIAFSALLLGNLRLASGFTIFTVVFLGILASLISTRKKKAKSE